MSGTSLPPERGNVYIYKCVTSNVLVFKSMPADVNSSVVHTTANKTKRVGATNGL